MSRIINCEAGNIGRDIVRDFLFEYKMKDDNTGTFEGYASTFGNEDSHGDIVMKGAFVKGLNAMAARGQKLKMLWNHDRHQPIGIYTKAAEDSKGLHVAGKFTKGVQRADETNLLMRDGAIDSMSIGGYVMNETYDKKSNTNALNEIDLREISPVTFPANKEARVTTVKSIEACVTIAELESHLRDVGGFSVKEAKAIIAMAKGLGVPPRDVADDAAVKSIRQIINNLSK